jgi:hypothetical protein
LLRAWVVTANSPAPRAAIVRRAIALLLGAGAALGAGAPKQTDVDACNREAAAVQSGKSPSTAPGSALPGSGPSGGQGSIQTRPMDSTKDMPKQEGMKRDMTPSSDLMKGMAPAGQNDPAFRATYLECLKKRGYTS